MASPVLRHNEDRVEAIGALLIDETTDRKVHIVSSPTVATPDYWARVYDNMGVMSVQGWKLHRQRLVSSSDLTIRERWILSLQKRVDRVFIRRAPKANLISREDRRFDKIASSMNVWTHDITTKEYASTFTGSLAIFTVRVFIGLIMLRLLPKEVFRVIMTDMEAGSTSRHGLHPEQLVESRAKFLVDACMAESGNVKMLVHVSCVPAVIAQLRDRGFTAEEDAAYYEPVFSIH